MFIELAKFNHLDLDRIVIIGLPCSQALADACACDHPTPAGKRPAALAQPVVSAEDGLPETVPERLEFWMDNFKECIRCYGCRNVCPLCFCKECALDNEDLTGTGVFPPDIPVFHIIRALDMADRCIDCGMCENVCPAKIPLRTLYRQMRRLVKETFGYEPGLDVNEKSPSENWGTRNVSAESCTNRSVARRDQPEVQVVEVGGALAVGDDAHPHRIAVLRYLHLELHWLPPLRP